MKHFKRNFLPVDQAQGNIAPSNDAAASHAIRPILRANDKSLRPQPVNRSLVVENRRVKRENIQLRIANARLIKSNARLLTIAATDALTLVANHRGFQERLLEEWHRSKRYETPFSVILLDLDEFKAFNDSYGHLEGDQVLKEAAWALCKAAREADFVARYGGEEFVIVLTETDARGAIEAAERFRTAIEGHLWPLRPVTASLGVATVMPSMQSAQALIDEADQAMYASKDAGRNQVTHSNTLPLPRLQERNCANLG